MAKKRALITGITGQDGSYLAELLLQNGYEVHGTSRPSSWASRTRFFQWTGLDKRVNKDLFIHTIDLTEHRQLWQLLSEIQPQEIYHLAGPSHVSHSLLQPQSVCLFVVSSGTNLLEWLRRCSPTTRLFNASSSLCFGAVDHWPQNENTPFRPTTPYAAAKAFVTDLVRVYRKRFNLFTSNGLLYNHESPRRHPRFVSQKICLAAAAIAKGIPGRLRIGSLDVQRDWGHAADYVKGMWQIVQYPEPQDYVLATGRLHEVGDLIQIAFEYIGKDPAQFIDLDPSLAKSSETYRYVGDSSKARELLGWEPRYSVKDTIEEMLQAALQKVETILAHRSRQTSSGPPSAKTPAPEPEGQSGERPS